MLDAASLNPDKRLGPSTNTCITMLIREILWIELLLLRLICAVSMVWKQIRNVEGAPGAVPQ
jgi:hypothetical protein